MTNSSPLVEYGSEDYDNAAAYSAQRVKLAEVRLIQDKYPHLAFLDVKVRQAEQSDYGFEPRFKSRALVVDVKVARKMCEKLNCDVNKQTGDVCRSQDQPHVEFIGSGKDPPVTVKCGFACYQLHPTNSDPPVAQSLPLRWNEVDRVCEHVHPGRAWFEQPWTRDTARYNYNVNNFAYGFNWDPKEDRYSPNAAFCNGFGDNYNEAIRNCVEPQFVAILGPIVGRTLLLTVSRLVEQGAVGPTTDRLLPDDRPKPADIPNLTSYEAWIRDSSQDAPVDPEMYIGGQPVASESQRATVQYDPDSKVPKWAQMLAEAILNMPEAIWPMFQQFAMSKFLDLLKAALKTAIAKLAERLVAGETIAQLISRGLFTENVMRASFRSAIRFTAERVLVRVASKTAIFLAETLAATISAVTVVLDVALLADLILTFWDPFKFNAGIKYPPELLRDLEGQFKNQFLQQTGFPSMECTFEHAFSVLSTPDTVIDLTLKSIVWQAEYFAHLTVTSEGTSTAGDRQLDPNDDDGTYQDVTQALVNLHITTPGQFSQDVDGFKQRLRTAQKLQTVFVATAVAGIAAGAILFQSILFACVFMIVLVSLRFLYIEYLTADSSSWVHDLVGTWWGFTTAADPRIPH